MPHRLKLLVAEDSAEDVFLLERAIKKTGAAFNTHFVTDGQDLMDYLSGEEGFANRDKFPMPSLVLLDLKMPRMNGFDVLKWLKAQPRISVTPVVVFSSSDDSRDVHRAYSLGASSYMIKPHDSDRLRDVVRALELYWREFCRVPDGMR